MASGWAKHTGGLGVCVGTTGPGAIHLMNGLYDGIRVRPIFGAATSIRSAK